MLLAAAFGLVQAGLIDQSLFNADYREGWDDLWQPTHIPVHGTGGWMVAVFIGGQVV